MYAPRRLAVPARLPVAVTRALRRCGTGARLQQPHIRQAGSDSASAPGLQWPSLRIGGTMRPTRIYRSLAASAALLTAIACHDAAGPDHKPAASLGNALTGNITVTTSTTGASLDPDGYTITVDLLQTQAVATNGSVTFTNLIPGAHIVSISGVAGNCSVSGGTTRTPVVLLGATVTVSFTVTCTATGPQTGDLTVTAATMGSNLDPDGYTVSVDGSQTRPLPTNGSVTFAGLSAGDHSVALSGVASHCSVSGPNPRTVTVTAGSSARTDFSVSCAATPPPTGNLTVTTSTTGSNLDPDGYTATVDGAASQPITDNGTVMFSGLSAGSHTVA